MLRNKVRNLTKDIHKYVENLLIMDSIKKSSISPQSYHNYLTQLQSIYYTIENHAFFKDKEFTLAYMIIAHRIAMK